MDQTPNELPLEALTDRNVGIKLIGVGGGGSNAVDRLKMENLDRLQLAVINTDLKALSTSPVQDKILIGTALTRDHSLWAELVATGRDVPPRHEFPFKNQITRALGLDGDAAADTSLIELAPGDRYLLCTDGLYDPFEDDALGALLREGTPAACCEHLVAEAWERGSSDNITAVIVDVAS